MGLGKRCPRKGVAVQTKAGLVGATTGSCPGRRVEVAVPGVGVGTFKRGELKKAGKRQQEWYAADLAKLKGPKPRTQRAPQRAPMDLTSFPVESYGPPRSEPTERILPGPHLVSQMYGVPSRRRRR